MKGDTEEMWWKDGVGRMNDLMKSSTGCLSAEVSDRAQSWKRVRRHERTLTARPSRF